MEGKGRKRGKKEEKGKKRRGEGRKEAGKREMEPKGH